MARKFLYVVAVLIVLALLGAFAYRMFGTQLMRAGAGADRAVRGRARADDERLCRSRCMDRAARSARQPRAVPAARRRDAGRQGAMPRSSSSIRPPISSAPAGTRRSDNAEANDRAALFLRGQASAFNAAGDIWAPRYRQATFGAFLTGQKRGAAGARPRLWRRRRRVRRIPGRSGRPRPIILAGHSQGALHLTRLLREKVAGKPLAKRIVAAYVVGWPVSRTTDLAALGLPECERPDQTGCLLSWQSFAEPADPSLILDMFDASTGFDGQPRRDTAMVCTNPLTGTPGDAAPASRQSRHARSLGRSDQRHADARRRPRALRPTGLPADRRRRRKCRRLCAARQQLPRLRLQPVLGQCPRRRRPAA